MKLPITLLLLAPLTPSCFAATLTWIGNTDTDWATAANWGAAAPAAGDNLAFGAAGTSGATLTDTLSGASLSGIVFNAGAAAYTMGGNAFTLTGNLTNGATTLQTLNQGFTLGAATTITTAASGGDITLGGAIDGGGFALGKAGAGTLTFSGTATNLGAITTSVTTGSALSIASGASVSAASLNGASVNNKGVVTVAGSLAVSGSVHINNNVAGAGTFTQTGGTVSFTTATDDVASFGNGVSIAFRVSATTQNTYALQGGTLTVANTTFYVSNGGGANGLLNITGGTANLAGLALSGTSSSAIGAVSLTGGRLNLGASGLTNGATTSGSSTVTVGAGTLGATADWSTSKAIALSNAATGATVNTLDAVDGATGRTISLGGALTGAGRLNKTGAGSLVLTGTNTFSGGVVISGGSVVTGNASALGSGGVSLAGGTLQIGNGTTQAVTLGASANLVTVASTSSVLKFAGATSSVALASGRSYDFSAGSLTLDLGGAFNAANTYTLVSGGSANVDAGSYAFAGADLANFHYAFGNGVLTVTAVPEAPAFGLLGAGALAAASFVRRRRAR